MYIHTFYLCLLEKSMKSNCVLYYYYIIICGGHQERELLLYIFAFINVTLRVKKKESKIIIY